MTGFIFHGNYFQISQWVEISVVFVLLIFSLYPLLLSTEGNSWSPHALVFVVTLGVKRLLINSQDKQACPSITEQTLWSAFVWLQWLDFQTRLLDVGEACSERGSLPQCGAELLLIVLPPSNQRSPTC